MIAWSDEQDRIQREAQRRANDAAAKEQARLQEIADRAAAKGHTTKAEQFEERALAVTAPIVTTEAPKVAGVSFREVWDFEITDEDLIPREYLVVDETKIRRVVTALKGDAKIPGVRVFKQKRIAAGVE
jgi:ATPase subunit of ABC transporter with duplicated ATPase domains